MEFVSEQELDTPVVTATLFGGHRMVVLVGIPAVAVAAVAAALIYKKKKGGARKNETAN